MFQWLLDGSLIFCWNHVPPLSRVFCAYFQNQARRGIVMSSLLILKIYRVWKLVYSVDCWYLETRNQSSGSWRTCSRILSTHWHTDTLNHRITWAEQTHGPQPLLTHLSLQTLHHLHSPPWRLYHADSSRSRCSGTKACSSSKVGVNETQRTHRWWWLWRSCPISTPAIHFCPVLRACAATWQYGVGNEPA